MVNYEHDPILEAYFRDVRQHDMISDSSQRELASEIQSRLAKIDQYEQKLDNNRVRPHTKAKIREEIPTLKGELRDLQSRLTEPNLRFVIHKVKNQKNKGLDYMDLIQEGNVQMFDRATLKYDPNNRSNSKFISYAGWWVWQGMSRAIAEQSRTVALPSYQFDNMRKVKKISKKIKLETGKSPYPDEISKLTKIPLNNVEIALKNMQETYSLDAPISEDSNTTLADNIPYENDSLEERGIKYNPDLNNIIENAGLTSIERRVIDLRFGLESRVPITLEEVGNEFGITREWVRQIERKAIKKFRNTASKLGLKQEDIL